MAMATLMSRKCKTTTNENDRVMLSGFSMLSEAEADSLLVS